MAWATRFERTARLDDPRQVLLARERLTERLYRRQSRLRDRRRSPRGHAARFPGERPRARWRWLYRALRQGSPHARYYPPRADWPRGAWDDEPDEVHWTDAETGLDCALWRNGMGAWCGYVVLPPGHPWSGLHYDQDGPSAAQVHGGLTFAGRLRPGGALLAHRAIAGRWALGFDTAHAFDFVPGIAALASAFPAPGSDSRAIELARSLHALRRQEIYMTLEMARAETEALARQVAVAAATATREAP